MPFVPAPPMLANHLGGLRNGVTPFSRLLCKMAITYFTVLSFVCSNRAAELGVTNLFLSSSFCTLRDEPRSCVNEGTIILLSREMKAAIKKWGLLTITNDCEVESVSTL